MRTLSQSDFNDLLDKATIKPTVKASLKYVKSTEHLGDDWTDFELVAISDRTDDKGILLLQPYDDLYLVRYEMSRGIADHLTGRKRAIICDFCQTWQPGSNAASIVFVHAMTRHKVGFLCCADLNCSRHVRTLTKESVVSRTQLRENLSDDDRVSRLKERLVQKIRQLDLAPLT